MMTDREKAMLSTLKRAIVEMENAQMPIRSERPMKIDLIAQFDQGLFTIKNLVALWEIEDAV